MIHAHDFDLCLHLAESPAQLTTSFYELWKSMISSEREQQFLLPYTDWYAHSNILLQCSITAWSLWRYFNTVNLKICCMWKSSGENNCLKSLWDPGIKIFFEVFQANKMWTKCFTKALWTNVKLKFDPHVVLLMQITEVTNEHILPTTNFTYTQITHMSWLTGLLSSCKIFWYGYQLQKS